MATPHMDTISRSLQNCSINHNHHHHSRHSSHSSSSNIGDEDGDGDVPPHTPTLDLNSQSSLPCHWEQCLDLKSGEIYFINWRTGMKVNEDPRSAAATEDYYSWEEDEYCSLYDSEESSSPSSNEKCDEEIISINEKEEEENNAAAAVNNNNNNNNVLVVAGCKSCLMYYMVPKQLQICPKCCGQLLHFDPS